MIYSYNKSQRDALFLKFILICQSSEVSRLYTQQQVFVMLVMLTVCWLASYVDYLLATQLNQFHPDPGSR